MTNKIFKVIDMLNELDDWQTLTHYHIIEKFINGYQEYNLINLTFIHETLEDSDLILATDINKEIECDTSKVLSAFLVNLLTDIVINNKYIKLVFEDGYIEIIY